MYSATIFSGFKNIQADNIDTLFNAYILEHGYRAFFDSTYKWSFFSPPFHYPLKDMLFESDNLLGTAPIYWIFRVFFDWSVSFQLWGIILTVLTYVSTLVLLLFFGINPIVAGLSSYAFAFGLPRIAQLSHPQLFGQFYMCFALLFLFKFITELKKRDFNLFMLFVTLQLIAGYYLGWFLVFSLYIAFFFYGTFNPDAMRKLIKEMTSSFYYLLSTILWGALNGLFWIKYFINGSNYKLYNLLEHAIGFLNIPMSYLTPVKGSLWAYILGSSNGITQENYIYPGIVFYILVGISALFVFGPYINPKKPAVRMFFAKFRELYIDDLPKDKAALIGTGFCTGVVLMLLTTSIFKASIWSLVYLFVPGSEAIRYAARIWIVAYLWFYISGGVALTYLLEKTPKLRINNWVIYAVIVFAVVEQFVIKPAYVDGVAFKQTISKAAIAINSAPQCNFTYFRSKEMPLEVVGAVNGPLRGSKNIEAMWTSFYTGVPTLNGYTAWLKYKFDKFYTSEDLARMTKRYGESACVYDEDGLVGIYKLPNK